MTVLCTSDFAYFINSAIFAFLKADKSWALIFVTCSTRKYCDK